MLPTTPRVLMGLVVFACGALPALAKAPPADRLGVVGMPIHAIQGTGIGSPVAGSRVTTRGVVTAVVADGYFLQSPVGQEDADPATSEGLFVYTGVAPAGVARGQEREVEGLVEEHFTGGNPNQLPLTRLADSQSVLLSGGQTLPPPVMLSESDLGADRDIEALERVEGMRVRPPLLQVTTPSGAARDESAGTVIGNGRFDAVAHTHGRPFREPGLSLLDAGSPPAGKMLDSFDGNPERLGVDSGAQVGAARLDVNARDGVKVAAAVMHYRDGAYTLLPDPGAASIQFYADQGIPAPLPRDSETTLAWLDLDRLYDDRDDPALDEPVLAAAAYQVRLRKVHAALCNYMRYPEIVAVSGFENPQVLQDLVATIQADEILCVLDAPDYQLRVAEGRGADGLDVGVLVMGRDALAGTPRVDVVGWEIVGADALLDSPDGRATPLFERPLALLGARLTDTGGAQARISILASQLQPLDGIDSVAPGRDGWVAAGDEVMARRAAQARFLAQWLEARQQAQPTEAMVLLGGFESHAFNDGRVDVLGAITGREAPANKVWLPVGTPVARPLTNPLLVSSSSDRYTRVRGGHAEATDHALVNAVLATWPVRQLHARFNADVAASNAGQLGAMRSAPSDPVLVRLQVPSFVSADVHVGLSAPTAQPPSQDGYVILQVGNLGPDQAGRVVLEFETSLAAGEYQLRPTWSNWTCSAATATAGGSRVRCDGSSLDTQLYPFDVVIPASPALVGRIATFSATVSGGDSDPDQANNSASASSNFGADTDVSLTALLYETDVLPGEDLSLGIQVRNESVNAPGLVEVDVILDAPAAIVRPGVYPGPFTCDAGMDIAANRSRFLCTIDPPPGDEIGILGFRVPTAVGDGGRTFSFEASVTTATPDSIQANNKGSATGQVSDRVDLKSRRLFDASGTLSDGVRIPYYLLHGIPGVARNARVEMDFDVTPSEFVEVLQPTEATTPITCGAPQPLSNGARTRVTCLMPPLILNTGTHTPVWSGVAVLRPVLAPGQAERLITSEVRFISDSEEQDPTDNAVSAVTPVDQTTDLALDLSAGYDEVAEPGLARFQVSMRGQGTNLPGSPRVRLQFDATFPAGDVWVSRSSGELVACQAAAAPAGSSAIDCPAILGDAYLAVDARTRPALADTTLTLAATVRSELVDTQPADNTGSASVRVLAAADLCVGPVCDNAGPPVPRKIDSGGLNTLRYAFRNFGPSTARGAVLTVDVALEPARVAARAGGHACAAATDIGGGLSRIACALGDLPGYAITREIELDVQAGGLPVGNLALALGITSAVNDPQAYNDRIQFQLPVVPLMDLSLAITSKTANYPVDATFVLTAAAAGPPNAGLSELHLRLETPGNSHPSQFDSPGWACSTILTTGPVQEYQCRRTSPLSGGVPSRVVMRVPTAGFQQIGSDIKVFAEHYYRPEALANDRTPGNNSVNHLRRVEGRSTKAVRTPVQGARPAAPPERVPAKGSRAALR